MLRRLLPVLVVASTAAAQVPRAGSIPTRLSDAEYWNLITTISEPGGYFRIVDNFTSNEREIGQLYTMLRERGASGGVFVGVGPEQNFTYIAAIRPAMAFIVDIRRQAVVQHLMYKAIFELSADRADFISMLFGKPRPPNVDRSMPIQDIWYAFMTVPADSALSARNYARIVEHLTQRHRFTFTTEEMTQLQSVFDAFFWYGPSITTRGGPVQGRRGMGNAATFRDLTAWSADAYGTPRSFLESDENYAFVKGLHERNLIVPVSGDFAGPKAIRAIGSYVKRRGAIVRAFYVSNVEQYLFGDGKSGAFYDNVATLPLDRESVFIRPSAVRRGGTGSAICPIRPFLAAARAGRVTNYLTARVCAA
jgi:hypothetical protein